MPWLTLSGSNYTYLEQTTMVPKMFEPLKFDCIGNSENIPTEICDQQFTIGLCVCAVLTMRMYRLIWVFIGSTCRKVIFLTASANLCAIIVHRIKIHVQTPLCNCLWTCAYCEDRNQPISVLHGYGLRRVKNVDCINKALRLGWDCAYHHENMPI